MISTWVWTLIYVLDLILCLWILYGGGAEWLRRGDFRRLIIFYPFYAWLEVHQIKSIFQFLLYFHSCAYIAGLVVPEIRDFIWVF